jgi:hypothetical protein
MNRIARLLVAAGSVFLAICFIPAGFAQANAGGKTSVTGCLQKGDEADEFSITGESGKMYGLRSSAVELSKHVGHKVTVTGTLKPESSEKIGEREEGGAAHQKRETGEVGDIQVMSLKMINENCQ